MKGTDSFRKAISRYLEQRGAEDPLFAETLQKPNKNIEDCITYILNQVQRSGCHGFEDSEIYDMAVHYYDEDDVKPGSPLSCKVVVNHVVEFTEEEKEEAKRQAFERIVNVERDRLEKKRTTQRKALPSKPEAKAENSMVGQQSLF